MRSDPVSTRQDSPNRLSLRPEFRPLSWFELDASQRKAYRKVVEALAEAIDNLDQNPAKGQARKRAFFDIPHSRGNQSMLMTGDRGTGKTSLLHTIAKSIVRPDDWETGNDPPAGLNARQIEEARGEFQEVEPLVKRIRGRVIWLDPLEMELLPGPTNLLASILGRVDNVMKRLPSRDDSNERQGLLDLRPESENALVELRRLMADASLAWDGNLDDRGSQLDPDAYAAEVMRAELVRIGLSARLSDVLENVAENQAWGGKAKSPLFILPVDDFDLNPPRCLELLQLVRMLQIPRVFMLILGDIQSLLSVARMKFMGDLAKIADIGLRADVFEKPFYHDHKKIAYDALRKLLPFEQRTHLENMQINEILDFRPFSGEKPLKKLLTEIPLDKINITKSSTLLDFLEHDGLGPIQYKTRSDRHVHSYAYSVMRRLQAAPRVVSDIWFGLQRVAHEIEHSPNNDEKWFQILKWLVDTCTELAAVDKSVSDDTKEAMAEIIVAEAGSPRKWRIRKNQVKVEYDPGSVMLVVAHDQYGIPPSSIELRTSGEWSFDPQADKLSIKLGGATAAVLTLTHDLIVVTSGGSEEPTLTPHPRNIRFACTQWRLNGGKRVDVNWLCPWFAQFRKFDFFVHAWNDAVSVISSRATQFPYEMERERLAFIWISTGTALIDSQPWLTGSNVLSPSSISDNDWELLIDRVELLAESLVLVDNPANEPMRETLKLSTLITHETWLESLAILLAPESGLPPGVAERFADAPNLQSFWEAHYLQIRQARADIAEEFIDNGETNLALRLTTPRQFKLEQTRQWSRTIRFVREALTEPSSEFAESPSELRKSRKFIESIQQHDVKINKTNVGRMKRLLEALVFNHPERQFSAEQSLNALLQFTDQKSFDRHPINSLGNGILCPNEQVQEILLRKRKRKPPMDPTDIVESTEDLEELT